MLVIFQTYIWNKPYPKVGFHTRYADNVVALALWMLLIYFDRQPVNYSNTMVQHIHDKLL